LQCHYIYEIKKVLIESFVEIAILKWHFVK